eukprot:TRINITY_DN5268_c0_g4_i11.p1 TRINITY_DN5268_c0_g4~~TRINITY_DN5268_c0_g4_i11.p1  ORF type:complete len:168 (-),score=22.23 TRINITY_DN5268_c0_g4_i11:559-1062(-)
MTLKMGGKKTAKLLKETRRCPNCGVSTEKIQGCPMMTCRCGTPWCYRCGSKVRGDSEALLRCTKCGASGWRDVESKPTCDTMFFATLCSPLWVSCGLLWCTITCPCAACLMCDDPGGAILCMCCIFEKAKDWYICCWEDPDKMWDTNNNQQWEELVINRRDSGPVLL